MSLNKEQAQYENDQLYNYAVQSDIEDLLEKDGPLYCGQVANRINKSPQEVRWHLTEIVKQGDASYNWITKRYSR